jgi:outer membrane protein assembly factor BamA
MNAARSMAFSVSGCILLTGSIVFGRQQDRELAGIHGLPVEGHDTVASVEIAGTKHIHLHKIHERLRSNGADVRLGLPLESQTLCRFKEVLRDVMSEKGFLEAEITYDVRPTYGDPHDLALKFTITEGPRSRQTAKTSPLSSPAERCQR